MESTSATPILDLQVPLPKPDAERTTGRFSLPFLTFTALIVFTGNLSFLMVLFGFVLIGFLTTFVHEFGHLIAGWSVGLHFEGVTIGPFVTRYKNRNLEFKLRPRFRGGLTYMGLDRLRRVRRRLIVLVLGGPLASLVSGAIALVGGEFALARYDSPWPTFFEFFGFFSLFIGFLALLPIRSGRYAGDGMQLRALLFSKKAATQMIASQALTSIKVHNLFPPDYYQRWWLMASVDTPVQYTRYYADWLEYEKAEDHHVAAECLERCLADSAILDNEGRGKLIVEAIVFSACRRNDLTKTEGWSKRIDSRYQLDPLNRIRIELARFYARQEFERALAETARGLSIIRSAPAGKQRDLCEAAWTAWHDQIQQNILTPVG
jgi:hypothetical protein